MATLTVELNGDGIHDVSAPAEFTSEGSFAVELVNRGEAVHVHLNLDDDLSRVADLPAGNHFVEANATRTVPVETAAVEGPRRGRLKVATGYGTETHWVSVTVEPPSPSSRSVEVDESLSRPAGGSESEPEPTPIAERVRAAAADVVPGARGLPSLALALLAVVLAVGVAVALGSPPVLFGLAVVLVAAVAASLLVVE